MQAFAIGCAILHCPITSGLDNLPANVKEVQSRASSYEPEGSEKIKAAMMAAEVNAALARRGALGEAHAQLYAPKFGGETSFATALLETMAMTSIHAPEDLVCARPSGRGRGGGELSVQFDVLIAFEPHKKHVEPLRKELID